MSKRKSKKEILPKDPPEADAVAHEKKDEKKKRKELQPYLHRLFRKKIAKPSASTKNIMVNALERCSEWYQQDFYERRNAASEYVLMERVKNSFLDTLQEPNIPHDRRRIVFVPGYKVDKRGVFYTRRIDMTVCPDFISTYEAAEDSKTEFRFECLTMPHVAVAEIKSFLDFMAPLNLFVCGIIGSYQYPLPEHLKHIAVKAKEQIKDEPESHAFAFRVWRDETGRHHFQVYDNTAANHNERFKTTPWFMSRFFGPDTVLHNSSGPSVGERRFSTNKKLLECVWCSHFITAYWLDWGIPMDEMNQEEGVPRNEWLEKSSCEVTWENILSAQPTNVSPSQAVPLNPFHGAIQGPNSEYYNKVISFGTTWNRDIYASYGFPIPALNDRLPLLTPGARETTISDMAAYVKKEQERSAFEVNVQ